MIQLLKIFSLSCFTLSAGIHVLSYFIINLQIGKGIFVLHLSLFVVIIPLIFIQNSYIRRNIKKKSVFDDDYEPLQGNRLQIQLLLLLGKAYISILILFSLYCLSFNFYYDSYWLNHPKSNEIIARFSSIWSFLYFVAFCYYSKYEKFR